MLTGKVLLMLRSALVSFAALALMAGPAMANGLTATQSVLKQVEIVQEDGTVTTELVEASLIAPGDTVVYVLTYTNSGTEAARAVELTMPVPVEMIFIDGSADTGTTDVTYSIDGGDSFAARDALTVMVDGETRDALAEDITHVRWTFMDSIAVGEEGEVSFRAVLN